MPQGSFNTLNPTINGTLSFNPGGSIFGMYSQWTFFGNRQVFSEDNLNTWHTGSGHRVRVYRLKNSLGGIVPNAFVLTTEEDSFGNDFNDVVYIMRNVMPAAGGVRFENLDWTALNSLGYPGMDFVNTWLSFSRILVPTSGARSHDIVTLRIHNDRHLESSGYFEFDDQQPGALYFA